MSASARVRRADVQGRRLLCASLLVGPSSNVKIRPGIFPDTAVGLEQEFFALAMLDVDIYVPTVAARESFYPRLSSGGYLFVHDYDSPESDNAMQRALGGFLPGKPEKVLELPDEWGSAVLRKV